jgi:hypothetical protein
MFAKKPGAALPIAILIGTLSTLSACGSSDSSSPSSPVANDPPPPTVPTTPAPPTTPPTTPPPPPTTPPVQITLAPTTTPISAAVSFSTDWWSDWNWTGSDDIQGVACKSGTQYHAHALISIYKDGQRLAVPANIGRNANCNYELQTADKSGVVHIQSSAAKTFTLGQFFAVWGQSLSADTVAGLVGKPSYYIIDNQTITQYTDDPQNIELKPHREVLIVTGTPPTQVPRYDWGTSGL